MINKILGIVFFFCTGISLTYAQSQEYGGIKGRITDNENLPLAGAEIIIENTEISTITDNNGFYNFEKLNPDNYTINVNYFGFTETHTPVQVSPEKFTTLNIQLEKGFTLGDLTVLGSLTGTAKALNQQKNMINVGNIISAEQVDQFPDDNMGDALKRVPGINVQYDQGEARFGNIRGTAPELSSVTMDGNRLPSAEGETRAFQLDLIPADMVQAIEVNKVVTPDMDGDAIGASVNLVTRSVPDAQRVRVDLSGGYNTVSEKVNYKGAVLYADRLFNKKVGVTLSGAVFNNFIGSENFEAEWKHKGGKNDEIYTDDFQVRKYDLQRLRQNYSAAFDYEINQNHRLKLSTSYNQRDDYENRYRLRHKKIKWNEKANEYTAEVRRETKGGVEKNARLERQKLKGFNLNGDHDFSFVKIDWGYIWSNASEERPLERYIGLRQKDVAVKPNFTDPRNVEVYPLDATDGTLNGFGLRELTQENQWTEETMKTAFINLKFPLAKGRYGNSLKVGAKFKFTDKLRDNDFYEYTPTDKKAFIADAIQNSIDQTVPDFMATNVPIGYFVTNSFLGGLDLQNQANFEKGKLNIEEIAGNYNAKEDIRAAYIRYNQKIGKQWLLVGGIRMEQTEVKYQGFITDIKNDAVTPTGTETQKFNNWMPSLLIKYSPTKLWNLKFGITNTIARPRYFDLVPYQIINQEDKEIKLGNPNLKPTQSLNIDLMAERYFKNVGLLEAGVFYKDITDFIVDERYTNYAYKGQTWDVFKRPINGGDAHLYGIELGFQRPLDFIAKSLRDFSLYTNYTFTKSTVKNFNIKGRKDDDLSLSGTPTHTLNTSLAYNTKKVEARISYNYASDFVEEYGEASFYDRYYDAVNYLDFNFGYNFSKKINAYLKINNILNQPLRYFQGEKERTMQVEYYGPKYKVGIQFNL